MATDTDAREIDIAEEFARLCRTSFTEDGGLKQTHQRTFLVDWDADGETFEVKTGRHNHIVMVGDDGHVDALDAGLRVEYVGTLSVEEAIALRRFLDDNYGPRLSGKGPIRKSGSQVGKRTLQRRAKERAEARPSPTRL